MTFDTPAAPDRARPDQVLSADNGPDRFRLMEVLRRAAPALPLGPSLLATVDVLLSCLPPRRTHHVVFASNATLTERLNGVTDRTLRRHIAELVEMGLARRINSPNGKRYSKRSALEGMALRFGIDLAPLFASFARLCQVAAENEAEAERIAYLGTKLRLALQAEEARSGPTEVTQAARRVLRRNRTAEEVQGWIDRLTPVNDMEGTLDVALPSASNGQNVRHHQNSEKELIEKTDPAPETVAEVCSEAATFLGHAPRTDHDIICHAITLAPMIGIDAASYEKARAEKGSMGAALTVWMLLQMGSRLRQPAAYFRAITSGARKDQFSPRATFDALRRQGQALSADKPRPACVT